VADNKRNLNIFSKEYVGSVEFKDCVENYGDLLKLSAYRLSDSSARLFAIDIEGRIGVIRISLTDNVSISHETWVDTSLDSISCISSLDKQSMYIGEYSRLFKLSIDLKKNEKKELIDFGIKIIRICKIYNHQYTFLENGRFFRLEPTGENTEFDSGFDKILSVSISPNSCLILIAGKRASFSKSFYIRIFNTPHFLVTEGSDNLIEIVKESIQIIENGKGNYQDMVCSLKRQGGINLLIKYLERILTKSNQKKLNSLRDKVFDELIEKLSTDRYHLKMGLYALYLNLNTEGDCLTSSESDQLKSKMITNYLAHKAIETSNRMLQDIVGSEFDTLRCAECFSSGGLSINLCNLTASCRCGKYTTLDPLNFRFLKNGENEGFCPGCHILQNGRLCFLCLRRIVMFDKLI